MRTAISVTGAPENHLLANISAAMNCFYNLPSCSWVPRLCENDPNEYLLRYKFNVFITKLEFSHTLKDWEPDEWYRFRADVY
jgi:hypothetical protein